ncbi:MAG TPA: flagellar biosynthesis protein FlhF [Sideroxyarcus sp.]|nr:flagellar biosynthesis protein FlhF [Sideroxyarcus sp.]
MNARKFIAASSRDALKLVRAELGEEAVILSNRKVPEGVEILAMDGAALEHLSETRATESAAKPARPAKLSAQAANQAALLGAKVLESDDKRETPAVQKPAVPATARQESAQEQQTLLSEIKSMRNLLQEQLACRSWSDMQQHDPARSGLLRDMLNVGFSPVLSRQLLEKIPAGGGLDWLRRMIGHNVRVATVQEDVVARGGVYALVGPTGVGKTTTTAKLAARAVVRYGADKVALVTTDSYRIGAHEQLKIYGKILGVSVHAVRDTEDLKLTLSGLKHKHLVLIDTMGVGQRDSRVAEQAQMFDAVGVQRLLLLNATSSGGTLDDVVKMYGGTGVIGCIPTKLDEAVTLGTVLDVIVRHKLTMHYIASGQRVPEDLHEVNLEYLLHRVFKDVSKSNTAFDMQEAELPAFMAGLGSAQRMAGGQYAL